MTRAQLVNEIFSKRSYLCVGLDTDISRIPLHLRSRPDAVFEFNQQVIDATREHCVAYKINTAFYEAMGSKGWDTLERTVQYIPPTHFTIADAKRGDIGNTSSQYAKAFFETLNFDAITVTPYMGEDSIRPFLEYENKWTIVLGLTSNPGAADFELKKVITQTDDLDEGIHTRKQETNFLYETVLETVAPWGNPGNLMFVAGATRAAELLNIRKYVPENFVRQQPFQPCGPVLLHRLQLLDDPVGPVIALFGAYRHFQFMNNLLDKSLSELRRHLDALEARVRDDHRVPIARGDARHQLAPAVAFQVLLARHQHGRVRVEPNELRRVLGKHVIGDHMAGLVDEAQTPQLHARDHAHRRFAGADDVEQPGVAGLHDSPHGIGLMRVQLVAA